MRSTTERLIEGLAMMDHPAAEKKLWGYSRLLARTDQIEVARIDVAAGGFCSWHLHQFKENVFHVVKGSLQIEWEPRFGVLQTKIVIAGDQPLLIPAGIKHIFRAVRAPVVCFESYYAAGNSKIDPQDIMRFSEGGVKV